MFSKTDIESNRAPPWKSIPTFRRVGTSSSSERSVMSVPLTTTVPSSGWSSPFIIRREMDFPEPDPPRMTRTSPARTSRSMASRTTFSPNARETFRNEMIVSPVN